MAQGVRITKNNSKAVKAEAARLLRQKLLLAGEIVRAEAVKSISEPTSLLGPSRPGEPPHAYTGMLRKSLVVVPQGDSVLVGSPIRYSVYLELGTSRMAARPFLRPAVYASIAKIKRLFRSK